ncbi:MAG: DedA family protein [Candidatus Hydrogenedentes bacterium]|nr:DedA family protein [Candidatus Hydrogenedentota bacterium]
MQYLRRLYDWMLKWADTPYGGPALFFIAFAESSVFPIPPDVLLIALCLGRRERWFRFAGLCTVGSLLGGLAGYAIGWGIWGAVDEWFFTYVPGFTREVYERVQGLYTTYDFWIIFVAAFTPIPYKIITITAGVFGIGLPMFVVATLVGRAARFMTVAYLIHRFGSPIQKFIERNFNLLTIVFSVLLVGGFVLLRFVGE